MLLKTEQYRLAFIPNNIDLHLLSLKKLMNFAFKGRYYSEKQS
ncbi:TPA: hypothetical protein OWT46_002591 [Staphylococcus aureus]|nr:hypothetical protein [Staphylococcus aureus]